MQIEDDVNYSEIRSIERNTNWRYLSLYRKSLICIDDPIERNIDDVCPLILFPLSLYPLLLLSPLFLS
jgi:hypothetical protein